MKLFPSSQWVSLHCLSVCVAVAFASSTVAAQKVIIKSDVAANPLSGGWYPWYETHVDPENSKNLLICGAKWNAKDNASYGFVYSSADGGKTWKQALEDKSSTWVSEESCAYGVDGVAYFVADASKVIDDELHHELGTTRIYASHDAGRTWKLSIETGWCDYSTSVVDPNPGPNQNRLYVYFNGPWLFYNSLNETDLAAAEDKLSPTGRLAFISYKDGDKKVSGPFSSTEMGREQYHGAYPSPAIVLKNKSIITFYTAKRRTDRGKEFMVEAVRTSADRMGLETPVKLVDSLDNPDADTSVICGGYYLGSAATYDSIHDKLYYAYSDIRDKSCHLFLTTSVDGGMSWSKPKQIYTGYAATVDESSAFYGTPSIAVNKYGVIAMAWEQSLRSGCWIFATSTDDGKSMLPAKKLGTCRPAELKPSLLNSNYLWTSLFQANPKDGTNSARINLRNTRNGGEPHEDGIAVGADGDFHPVWTDTGKGSGEIRTATIQVVPADTLVAVANKGMENVTEKVAILYGGDQYYDPQSKTLTVDVTIKNTGDQPLHGPFRLAVTGLYKDYGYAAIENAENGVTGAGGVWDIASSIPEGMLAPGAKSKPFPLKFSYLADPDTKRGSDDILGLDVQVYAKASQ